MQPAQVLIVVPPQPAMVQPTVHAIPVNQQVPQVAVQPAVQGQILMVPQGPQGQQLVAGHAATVPTGAQATATLANPTVQQPGNPVLQNALCQAMVQQGHTGSVTMDYVGNLLLTSGRGSLCYRHTNASEDFQRQFQNR